MKEQNALLLAASSLIPRDEERAARNVALNQISFSPASHENELLRPPESFQCQDGSFVTERPCLFSVACIGRDPAIMDSHLFDGGQTLREYTTPEEELNLRLHGTQPSQRRFCLLCERWKAERLLGGLELLESEEEERAPGVINFFHNRAGRGEYDERALLQGLGAPDGSVLLGRVVAPSLHRLRWARTAEGKPFVVQERLAFGVARLSPASAFSLAAAGLAGTSLDLQAHHMSQVAAYQERFATFQQEKTGRSSGGIRMVVKTTDDEDETGPIDAAELPAFVWRPPTTGEVIQAGVFDLSVLALFNLLFFTGAFVAFLRYDVR